MQIVSKRLIGKLHKIVELGNMIIDAFPELDSKAYDNAAEKVINEYKNKYELIVMNWYGAYTRKSYDPTLSLKDSYSFEYDPESGSISFDWGAHLVPEVHRLGSAKLWALTAEKGYHGGAISGPNHPHPGTYWYHVPGVKGAWVPESKGGRAVSTEPFAGRLRGLEREFNIKGRNTLNQYYNDMSTQYLNELIQNSGIYNYL